ncbi:MAG: hypothetical protein ACT4TC_05625 [Myxococcaceae bacterium]
MRLIPQVPQVVSGPVSRIAGDAASGAARTTGQAVGTLVNSAVTSALVRRLLAHFQDGFTESIRTGPVPPMLTAAADKLPELLADPAQAPRVALVAAVAAADVVKHPTSLQRAADLVTVRQGPDPLLEAFGGPPRRVSKRLRGAFFPKSTPG